VPRYYSLSEALRGAAHWYHLVGEPKKAPSGSAAYGLMPMNQFINALYAYQAPPTLKEPLHPGNHTKALRQGTNSTSKHNMPNMSLLQL